MVVNTLSKGFAGTIIQLEPQMIRIKKVQGSFFDMIQNVWGFALLCFGVLLMKATKYINLREKTQKLSAERTEFRDSICVLLAKVHSLRMGRLRHELDRAKHYLKQPLPSTTDDR